MTNTTTQLAVGTIMVSKNGWEQTNVQFFRVVAVSPTMATLQPVRSIAMDTGDMRGIAMPSTVPNGKPLRRKIQNHDGRALLVLDRYSMGRIATEWSGKEQEFTTYG